MVLAYHLVWVAYGWWLPNDLRGSISTTIRNDVLRELGELHFGRNRVQPAGRDIRAFYEAAKEVLRHELLTFTEIDIGMMAHAFAEVIRAERYTCYACALMPDHVHIVIRKHRDRAEQMIEKLQRAGRENVLLLNLRNPYHPVWGGPGWKVFLNTPANIGRTVKYVEDNPAKARLPTQSYDFVTKYDGWSFQNRSR